MNRSIKKHEYKKYVLEKSKLAKKKKLIIFI